MKTWMSTGYKASDETVQMTHKCTHSYDKWRKYALIYKTSKGTGVIDKKCILLVSEIVSEGSSAGSALRL